MEQQKSIELKKEYYLFKLKYKTKKVEKLKLFGKFFILKNKLSCKMIYKNKTYQLKEYLDDIDTNYKTKDFISIKLRLTNNYFNANEMFKECNCLVSISDITITKKFVDHETNNYYIMNMRRLFYGCKSLESIPDISEWDTTYVVNISGLFYECSSLKSLPDISKWDTTNIRVITSLFCGCSLLKSLPDISKWNTKNVRDMNCLFYNCHSLISLPDISNWDTSNVNDMSALFF